MKRATAILVSIVLLGMVIMTGCNVQQVSAPASTPTPTATPIKSVISPTATIDTVLTQDTLFEETNFSIVIPKDAAFKRNGRIDSWYISFKGAVLGIMIGVNAEKFTTAYYTNSEENINTAISDLETGAGNSIKMEAGYKKATIGNYSAIVLTGKYIKNAIGPIWVYYVDTSKGLITIVVAEVLASSDVTVPKELNITLENILNSIIFK